MTKTKLKKLLKEQEELNRWIGQTFTERECVKINRLIEVELLLEEANNK